MPMFVLENKLDSGAFVRVAEFGEGHNLLLEVAARLKTFAFPLHGGYKGAARAWHFFLNLHLVGDSFFAHAYAATGKIVSVDNVKR